MFKKATKSIAWLAVLVLALSIFAGYFASVQFSAEAAGGTGTISLFSGQVDSKVKYGNKFSVPVDANINVTVKAPNGSPATVTAGEVEAKQLGTYEVTVKSSSSVKVFYNYNVQCYLDGDYILVIDKGGAIIPSYWEASGDADKKIKLPDANVYVYDEDAEEYVKDNSQDINIRVTSPLGVETRYFIDKSANTVEIDGGNPVDIKGKDYVAELTLNTVGKWFFTYYTYVEGETNVLSEEFVTQVQKQFDDETAPLLNAPGVPATASINTKVTIPTAIVSDNYDKNVIVNISVKHKYNNVTLDVPMTVIDKKTGYVTTTGDRFKDKDDETQLTDTVANAVPAIFDNDRFMYFYPTEAGSYILTYQAQDTSCFYNINPKNATVEYVYTIVVTDTTAPVFDSIDDYKIPTEWGNDVYMYDESFAKNEGPVTDKNIHFPIPEVYDNYDKSEDIAVSFNFTDNGGRTVASFDNINSLEASKDNRYMPSSNLSLKNPTDGLPYYFFRWQDNYNIDGDGKLTPMTPAGSQPIGYDFATVFNFDLWNPKTTGTTATKHGEYRIEYTARDNSGARNFQAKQYSIRYSSEYKDLVAPDIRFNVPSYIAFTAIEEEIRITDVRVTDSGASRINSEYYVVFNQNSGLTKDDFDDIISGNDMIRLDSTLGSNILKVEKFEGKCRITAKNLDGIDQTVDNINTAKPIYVAVRATDSVGNERILVKEITAIDATDSSGKSCTIRTNGYFGRSREGAANYQLNTESGVKGEEYCVGNFTVKFNNLDRKQTGFEIYAQKIATIDSGNNYTYLENDKITLANIAYETYSTNDGKSQEIYIDNVRFTPSSDGVYMLVVRGYHISGLSDVMAHYVEVGGSSNGGPGLIEKAAIPPKGDVNVTYTITSEIEPSKAGSYVVSSFSGGRMSLMYDQFTAMSGTVYGLMDYPVLPTATSDNYGFISYDYTKNSTDKISYRPLDSDDGKAPASKTNYTFDASDSQAPSIRLLDIMPTYSPKNEPIILPQVSATSVNGIVANLECTIEYAKGGNVSKTLSAVGGNSYTFVGENDGVYKVTYNATINGNHSSAIFEISVGDVVPPTFNVTDFGFATSNGDHIIGYINDSAIKSGQGTNFSATIGDTFKFGHISVLDDTRTGYTYSKQLKDPSGESADQTTSYSSYGNSVTFTTAGYYTVIYTVTDENGNDTFVEYKINVTSSKVNISTEAIMNLSIVLIVIGIILVAGVIIYLVRFRKHKRA